MEIAHRSIDRVHPKKALGHEVVAKPCARPRENCCSSCPIAILTLASAKRVLRSVDHSASVAPAKELHHQKLFTQHC